MSPTGLEPPPRRQDHPGASVGAMAGDARCRHGFPRGRRWAGPGSAAGVNPVRVRGPQNGEVAGGQWQETGPQDGQTVAPCPSLCGKHLQRRILSRVRRPLGKSEPQRHVKEPGNGQPCAVALLFS